MRALERFGYTAREAEFLELAALHSGSFLRRQFCPARGKLANSLCRKVVALGHAKATVYRRNTHLYHLCAKPLYAAIGQSESRHRRESCRIRAKVMGLDYVLLHSECRFLASETEKLGYFESRGVPREAFPTLFYAGPNRPMTAHYFADKFPIRVGSDGRVGFCYIDDGIFTSPSFPTWLRCYTPLLTLLGQADVVYVGTDDRGARKAFLRQFPADNAMPEGDLLAYFQLRHDIEIVGLGGRRQEVLDVYRRFSRRFAGSQFEEQYAAWTHGSPRGSAPAGICFASFVLPFSYAFFGTGTGGGQ